MGKFFNPDNWLWKGFGRLADYFLLSACWLIASVPLFTVGAASIALYDTVAHCIRQNEGQMYKRFFGTLRKELTRGIGLTVLWVIICFLLNMGYQLITQLAGAGSILSIAYFVTLFIPLGIICWLVAIESRFEYSFGELHRTAVLFTFAHLPATVAVTALLVVVVNVIVNFPFFLIFLPALLTQLQSVFIEKVFQKYMPEEE